MGPPPGAPVVSGGGLRPLLRVVYALVAGLTASAIYLGAVTAADWLMGGSHQGYVYQWALVAHLGLGVLVLAPFVLFAAAHARAARSHPNQRAARIG